MPSMPMSCTQAVDMQLQPACQGAEALRGLHRGSGGWGRGAEPHRRPGSVLAPTAQQAPEGRCSGKPPTVA